jgi:CheY-like chemotaxis protein
VHGCLQTGYQNSLLLLSLLHKPLTTMPTNRRLILCVDDDPDDHMLVCEVIREAYESFNVVGAQNGEEALKLLRKSKETGDLPCLVILDINMPRMDGKQTLVEIKKDEGLRHVPIVMLSTSNSPIDKVFCDHYGVALYTKPDNVAGFSPILKKLLTHCSNPV